MRQSLEDFIEATQHLESESVLFRLFDTFVGAYGVDVTSYHITAQNLRSVPIDVGLVRENFPDDWVSHYIKQKYAEIDPVIAQSRMEMRPFHWFDIGDKITLSAQQKAFLDELKAAGLTDGLAVPVFGPKGTIAYFGLGTCGGNLHLPESEISELQFACHQTHNQYIELSGHGDVEPHIKLSKRETEVLGHIATGLSNNYVAERMGISENTVDTMLRRTFKKLGVNNRISAVLRGIGSGLILP